MVSNEPKADRSSDSRRASNVRTALVLLSIAAVFFFGVIVNRYLYA